MDQIKIVIPSYKRADRVRSSKLVLDPILCVAESEAEAYRDYNPDTEIVTHPDSVKGLVAKRNWMYNHFGDLFMIDDDVMTFHKLHTPPDVPAECIKDPKVVTDSINRLYTIAKMLGINLFGFTKSTRPIMYKPFKPYSLNSMITGCAYGVIKSPNIYWPEDLKLKEDFWISCWIKYKERMILVDNRFNFTQKDTFFNPGGLSEIRNDKTELEAMLFIKKMFGDVIDLKRDNVQVSSAKKYNITCHFPF